MTNFDSNNLSSDRKMATVNKLLMSKSAIDSRIFYAHIYVANLLFA